MTSVTFPSSSGPILGSYNSAEEKEEASRPIKRCFSSYPAGGDSCKKRRKQSTPVRISASDTSPAGRETATPESPRDLSVELKKEPLEPPPTPPEFLQNRPDPPPWLPDKEWMSANILQFSPANHLFMSLPPFSQPDGVPPRQQIRIFNPDAYCELCNKEFCNKYFLKTHKANKHGIYSDPPASEQQPASVNVPSYSNNTKYAGPNSADMKNFKIAKFGDTSVNEPGPPFLHMENWKTDPPKSQHNPFPDIYPFQNKPQQKSVKIGLFDPDSSACLSNGVPNGEDRVEPAINETSSSPKTSRSDSGVVFKTELSFTDQESPAFFAPSPPASTADRLRKIGVMNPKAFCEICRKEYCNKYFLRTHKMKRHGIFVPDDGKDIKGEWSHNIQTSPLNLIVTEQNGGPDGKTFSPPEAACDKCGIKFQNASLARLHDISVHNIKFEANEKIDSSNPDAISEDLQKLQTLVLQLNDLDVNKAASTCGICSKEFENRFYLQAHLVTEHGSVPEDTESDKNGERENVEDGNVICDICGKELPDAEEARRHYSEFHSGKGAGVMDAKEELATPEKGGNRPATGRSSANLTPTSSYCEICNKELCNKYFMKTHMQRMHGIEIENGAQIGGVVCDICNKELCSKYFLRVHKHNTHGIVEYGAGPFQPRKAEDQTGEPDPALKPADLADLSHRYFTHFTEVCSICARRFRSAKWLKAHLLSDHGQAGAEKWQELERQSASSSSKGQISPTLKIPNGGQESPFPPKARIQNVLSTLFGSDENHAKTYQCSYCPFSTTVLPFLFVHERSHSMVPEGDRFKCPTCPQTFHQADLFQQHVFSKHPYVPLAEGGAENQGEIAKEPSESAEEADDPDKKYQTAKASKKNPAKKPLFNDALKMTAKKYKLPASYAFPQDEGAGYVMQAFLVDETAPPADEKRFAPSVVFLPVPRKLSGPLSATFNLTPA